MFAGRQGRARFGEGPLHTQTLLKEKELLHPRGGDGGLNQAGPMCV